MVEMGVNEKGKGWIWRGGREGGREKEMVCERESEGGSELERKRMNLERRERGKGERETMCVKERAREGLNEKGKEGVKCC